MIVGWMPYMRKRSTAVSMPASHLQAPPTKHGKSEDFICCRSPHHYGGHSRVFSESSICSTTTSRPIISHLPLGVSYASFTVSCCTSLTVPLNGLIFRLGSCSLAPFTLRTKRDNANGREGRTFCKLERAFCAPVASEQSQSTNLCSGPCTFWSTIQNYQVATSEQKLIEYCN